MFSSTTFSVPTRRKNEMIDITGAVFDIVRQRGIKSGICTVFVPHTTAAVTINENADPDVPRDILVAFERIVPRDGDYAHSEGNSPAHLKALLTGSSVTVAVETGNIQLGTWQGIFLCEFDGPRNRQVRVSVLCESAASS
ncbi:MAG TPA: secondary thiamine-phosphate synthase enzyme YjbQ [Candidatus Latescibacteria bacterium]|nr:secondary thiamine-phosphate synthase enzyme YjbQ [Candidatus Latescibacterota bacterium]HQK23118.1 secondary thiamine-phosphate synthase enzyme YjbQ [Candidatus Latescibacterota bacterium]